MEEPFLTPREKYILFGSVGVFLAIVLLTFLLPAKKNIGDEREVKENEESLILESPITAPSNEATTTISNSSVPEVQTNTAKDYRYLFTDPPRKPGYSNVVGYLGYTFALSLPDWLSEQWRTAPTPTSFKGMDITAFTPREAISDRSFSDIRIESRTSSENFNAQYLYDLKKKEYQNLRSLDASYTFEFFYNNSGNLLVYYIEKRTETEIEQTFYMDALGRTAIITFSAIGPYKEFYAKKVIDFVKGFESNNLPQG